MEKIKECPICGGTKAKVVRTAPYFRGSRESFTVEECQECLFWYTNPRPVPGPELNAYYDTEDYVSHTDAKKGLIDWLYHLVRNYALGQKLKLVNKWSPQKPGKLLDYGCGTGAFLDTAVKAGWKATGVEPSQVARENCAKRGLEVFDPDEEASYSGDQYQVVSMWHVLEHLPDPLKKVRRFSQMLAKNGVLIIAVPNHESYDSLVYGDAWAALDAPLHLSHFKKRNIQSIADKAGLELVHIRGMPFDSFYVSMLSEKIAHGKPNLPRAVLQGLVSNWKARANNNASSLIYILRKP